jgi:DNA-binding beta-propeller fold protein YncE
LRRLREQYPDTLVVIGVHSAKFPAEKLTENIRAAVLRHGMEHPVVNDADFAVWGQFAVRAWPTVVLIDPAGKVVGQQSGEIDAEEFYPVLDAMFADFDSRGLLRRDPVPALAGLNVRSPGRQLHFPAKLTLGTGDRLYIADSGHHRVLEVQLSLDGFSGEIVRTFGLGEPGFADGPVHLARFHSPHGLALHDNTLYVADTENHAIRAIDLVREEVRTVAGTGRKARGLRAQGDSPTEIDLRSPWGLAAMDQLLFIAMAGSHQIWVLIQEQKLGVFAGTGAEALVDGGRGEAGFNQPSDLALTLGHLFVADAEASAVRAIALSGEMQVFTLVGQGLFEFGDMDGKGAAVRLQHPTGLAASPEESGLGLLYVADSYNHKIKSLDPATGYVSTLIGSGQRGLVDGPWEDAQLFEPEGVAATGRRLYIADTNNHQIRVADLATRQIHTLVLT